ncbi:MAG: XRE family transcriptional regulator [Sulfurimonas sp.]|nr:XRE family transcriptional regulator [Sulfurimonas sp.]MDQ7067727.1 XRE family transcriptional regulator [Sulfurimonas sp.]
MKKEEFTRTLKKENLAKKEFANLANISYNTVNNWNDDNKPVPPWVKSWLQNYIKAKVSEEVIKSVKPFINTKREK